jgi:hypothetical protein
MPNHVFNILQLSNPDEKPELDVIVATLREKFTLNAVIPQPEGIFLGAVSEADRKANPLNWYDWNVPNWGTKWDAYDAVWHLTGDFIGDSVSFCTAWSPPTPVIEKLKEMGFAVRFQWFNPADDTWTIED